MDFFDWLATEELRAPTANPNFMSWFGDSKVVDSQGRPKVVYHGAKTGFSSFNVSNQNPKALYGPGFYFTEDPGEAGDYSMRTTDPFQGQLQTGTPMMHAVYLRVRKPYVADSMYQRMRSAGSYKDPRTMFGYDFLQSVMGGNQQATERLKSLGYDGIKVGRHWIVFSPNQVKSVYNKGGYSPQSNELGEHLSP